jgi:phytoene desaturase
VKIVVIGAGLGGLTAAARLSALGHSVDLFEASDRHGGKCRTEEIDGFSFDTGPSLLTLPAVYRDFFLKTGDRMEQVLPIEGVDPAFAYRFADGSEVLIPNGPQQRIVKAIEEQLGATSASEWQALMTRASSMWEVSRSPFVESELRGMASLLRRPTLINDMRTIAPWKTLRSLGKESLTDPRLRMILDRYATYTGSDPRRAPAVLATIAFVEQNFGAWHIPGGVGRLADAVRDRAIERGVKLHFNAKVDQIRTAGDRVCGILLADGTSIDADVVISNADATQTYSTLLSPKVQGVSKARRRQSRSTPSLAGFVMLLGLTGRTAGLHHHNVLFPEKYDEEFDAVFGHDGFRPAATPAIYICAPDDPLMRPDDKSESWFVLVNTPRHDSGKEGFDWSHPSTGAAYGEQILDLIEARGHRIRDRIRVHRTLTPYDLQETVRAPGGSIYGTSSNGVNAAFRRAANTSPVNGLFCVGGSAHPGGGLPLVGMSGAIVAQAIGRA